MKRFINFIKTHQSGFIYTLLGVFIAFFLITVFHYLVYGGINIPTKVEFTPKGEVPLQTNFTFEFSYPVVETTEVGKFFDKEENIEFSPKIAGKFKWLSNRELRFYPYGPLKGATSYQVSIKPEICKLENVYLRGKKRFEFHTPPLKIILSRTRFIYERRPEIISRIEWRIEFNYEVVPKELQNHIKFYFERFLPVSIPYQLQPIDEPSRIFKLISEPIERKKKVEQELRLRVRKGLKPKEGDLGLPADFVDSLKIEPDLKIYEIYSYQSEYKSWIRINFSSSVCPKLAEEYIKIEPEIEFKIEQRGHNLDLKGDFTPGKWYKVTILEGLPAADGTFLQNTLTQNVKIEDLEPYVEFTSKGKYLLRRGELNLEIKSVNINKLLIEVKKIFENNLVHLLTTSPDYYDEYEYYYGGPYLSKKIYSEEVVLDAEKNKIVKTIFNMEQFLKGKRLGLFNVVVRDSEQLWREDALAVIITDLGIVAKRAPDELFVCINSLKTLEPIEGVEVKLVSKTNQLLAEDTTDKDGICIIKELREKIEDFEPYVIVAKKGDDFSFLKFEDTRIPIHFFDIGGREYLMSGYEAYLYTDRGVYRPDDTVHLVGVVRGKEVSLPGKFPVILKVFDPQDRIFKELKVNLNDEGSCEFRLDIPQYARTGKYRASLFVADNEVGRVDFRVEEFIPDRIKVKVTTDRRSYKVGDKVKVDVSGVYLFGPPATNKKVKGECRIVSWSFVPKNWGMYKFGDEDKGFSELTIPFNEAKLDENGKHRFELVIPSGIKPPMALCGRIHSTVLEEGGRAVSAYTTIDIHPYPFYIGLKPKVEGYAEPGKEYEIEYVVVDKDGEEVEPRVLDVSIYRIIWQTILKKDDKGYWRWVSESTEELLDSFTTKPSYTKRIVFIPQDYGEYKVVVKEPRSESSASFKFYASGWGYAPWSLANPDKISLTLEKAQYRVGETAKLQVKSPFAGELLLTIERQCIFSYRRYSLTENTALIEVPIKEDYAPNVYIYATILRKLEPTSDPMPIRAFGITPLMIEPEGKRLKIEIESPDVIRPKEELKIDLRIRNRPGAYLTVAAVDEGILQLTNFKTPEIFDFFYGKKRLNTESFDLYSLLLPEVKKPKKPGGDRPEEVRKKYLVPLSVKRVKPVALWSGLVSTDREGYCKVRFKLPQFQGKLRLMVVAFNSSYLASTHTFVTVRDPIVVIPTFPRFLTSNDRFKVPIGVYNGTGRSGKIKVSLSVDGEVKIIEEATKEIEVKAGKEVYLYFKLKVGNTMGKVKFRVEAEGLDEKTYHEVELLIRPPSPPLTLTGAGSIKEGKPISLSLPTGWIPNTQHVRLILSAFPTVKLSSSLQYLLKYPHGCIEQTTSRVFPLLYFDELAKKVEPELFRKHPAAYYISEGIDKLEQMQLDSGAFSFWPGEGWVSEWGSVYASHFLVEAEKAGYPVSGRVYKKMLKYLKKLVKEPAKDSWALEQQAYACYVLAIAGKPEKSSMNFLKEYKLKELSTFSRFQLASAFAYAGDIKTAKALLPIEIQPVPEMDRETGGNFNSSTRANAIMLDTLIEIFPDSPAIPILVKDLFSRADKDLGRWYTTQENAFALLALGKAFKKFEKAKFKGYIKVNGRLYKDFDEKGITIEDEELIGKRIKIGIRGKGNCYYYWQVWGIKEGETFPEYEKGISVCRIFLDHNGNTLSYDRIPQGEILVAKIIVKALKEDLENVIICDLLPTGLEIENPRLAARATIPWVEEKAKPDYMDIRDDRLILYTSLSYNTERVFYYTLRAVTQGNFILPPVLAECMYDPSYTAITSSGRMEVIGESTSSNPKVKR